MDLLPGVTGQEVLEVGDQVSRFIVQLTGRSHGATLDVTAVDETHAAGIAKEQFVEDFPAEDPRDVVAVAEPAMTLFDTEGQGRR